MTQSRTATSKPADDKPFDFNLDAVKAETELLPFRVHFDGRRFEMAHLESLDVWDLLVAAGQGDMGMMLAAFKAALGGDYEEFRKVKLPQFKLKALFKAYQAHCGVESGESQASTDS